MTNSRFDKGAYVWVWLPGETAPVVCGKLETNGRQHDFYYGQSYLNNPSSISLSKSELPLIAGKRFSSKYDIHQVIYDSLPDAWGRRVLAHEYPGKTLSPIELLLLSSSDRIGALHYQETADEYVPKYENHADLEQLLEATSFIETGQPLPKELGIAINHGTSVGGARPKALIGDGHKKYIAKFSSSTDTFPIVQAEFAAMWLAKKIGLDVAHVKLVNVAKKNVLLVERFDRKFLPKGWLRKFMVSGLTILELDEFSARYASYLDLADNIRKLCKNPVHDLDELFKRLVFNILIGNTDDHAKNFAFFWDGINYELTPAYDICPYLRAGQEATQATQAMILGEYGAASQLKNVLSAAPYFGLTVEQANSEIEKMVEEIKKLWPLACEAASLTKFQCEQLTGTAILNPYCFYK